MKELDDFTVERLTELSMRENLPEVAALARIALAAKTAEESHSRREVWDGGNTWVQCSKQAFDRHEAAGKRVRVLYEKVVLPNSPELPDGWKLVPIEPTESMVIDGFESVPDQFFSEEDEWNAYQKMSGCQQASHRAKLCWAAMLGAAPKPEK
ncbi:hypothetical protein AV650_22190 [Serratia fonticola]|nr:hypothetical protein AV650_22190 [Serratia fonticola]